jgi:membrane-associated phospholipid phosphatase
MNTLMAVLLLAVAGQDDATPTPPASVQEASPETSAPAPKAQAPEVYRLRLAADIPIIVVGVGAGLARELFKDKLARKSCPCDSASINRLDRWAVGYHSQAASVAADVTVYGVLIALPFVDLIDVGFGRALGEDLVVYVEALAVTTAIQNATNFITARPRPRSYAGDPTMANRGEGYLSFYAGHVSTVSAGLAMVALTIRKRYGEQVWPWIAAALITSSVAVERVASGHHFPTDVAVAAVAGTAVGFAVPWLHFRSGKTYAQIAPVGTNGLGLVGAF